MCLASAGSELDRRWPSGKTISASGEPSDEGSSTRVDENRIRSGNRFAPERPPRFSSRTAQLRSPSMPLYRRSTLEGISPCMLLTG